MDSTLAQPEFQKSPFFRKIQRLGIIYTSMRTNDGLVDSSLLNKLNVCYFLMCASMAGSVVYLMNIKKQILQNPQNTDMLKKKGAKSFIPFCFYFPITCYFFYKTYNSASEEEIQKRIKIKDEKIYQLIDQAKVEHLEKQAEQSISFKQKMEKVRKDREERERQRAQTVLQAKAQL